MRHEARKRRGRFGMVLFLVLAGFGAYLVFGASDERRVLGVLRELAAAVNSQPGESEASRQRRVQSVLARLATPGVLLEVPEFGETTGASRIAALLAHVEGVPLRVSIEQSSVYTGSGRAQGTLLVNCSLNLAGEERIEKRTVTAQLVRQNSGFLVETLRVSSRSRDQPEARP